MPTPKLLEARIEEKATTYARSLGMLALKLNVKGQVGWPDYFYIYNGGVLFIEFKSFRQKPRPIQEHVHRLLRDHHIDVVVVDNLIDATEAINEFYRNYKLATVR